MCRICYHQGRCVGHARGGVCVGHARGGGCVGHARGGVGGVGHAITRGVV